MITMTIIPNLQSPEFEFAIRAVRQAAWLARQVQAEMAALSAAKEDHSPVTVADFAAQALVGGLLADAFPNDLLVAEENLGSLRSAAFLPQVTEFVARFSPAASAADVCEWIGRGAADSGKRFWTLDPVDGTKGFLRGGQYASALALIEDGAVQVAALGCPNLSDGYRPEAGGEGSLAAAARSEGAWLTSLSGWGNFERLAVSTRGDVREARLLRSFEAAHTNVARLDELTHALQITAEPLRMDSQAKFCLLAAGKGEAIVRLLPAGNDSYREKIWDVAAGSLIVEEAGGRVTDLDGKPLDFTTGRELARNRGVLASNGRIHAALVEALANV